MNELRVPTLGTTTHAWEYGADSGVPLILVHGFRGDHHGLEGVAEAFVARHPQLRLIVPDLPGFGATAPLPGREHDLTAFGDWLRAFVQQVAPERHTVLGHSFGSLVVSQAIMQGLDPTRAILVNPISSPALQGPRALLTRAAIAYYRVADWLPERPARLLLGHSAIVRVMSEVMAKTKESELRRWIHGQHAAYFSTFVDTSSLSEAFRASVSHTVTEFAEHFDMPTLIIAGERDDISELPAQLELHRRIPGSRLEIFPGVGHLIHYESVADTVEVLTEFLAAQPAADHDGVVSTAR